MIGIRIGKRFQEDAADDAVDRGLGADADSECEQDRAGEAGRLSQSAKCELQVGKRRFESGPLPDLAALFLEKGHVPKAAKGSLSSFGAREILQAHQLLGSLFEVLAEFLGQLVTKLPAIEYAR